ncbi:MAG TPA: hypothetical protein VFE96_01165 [Candidatus Bathyarchaeia archaeon]|jgi:hypothetical protein|nr:hypothetical protein [Candidatus Bathyarchaeia archaeon]
MRSDPHEMWNARSTLLGPARVGELVATTLVACLVAGFYGAHLAWSTGFFTSAFTPVLAVLFFTSIFWPIANVACKAITFRKDVRALVEWMGAALFAGETAWVYAVFPFNFTHLADVLPPPMQFILSWLTNDIGRILVALILVASIIALAVTSVKLAWRVSVTPLTSDRGN